METMEMICGMARFRRLRIGDLVSDINKGEWKVLMTIGELGTRAAVDAGPIVDGQAPGSGADRAGAPPAEVADRAGAPPVKVSAITEVLPMPAPALSRWLRSLEKKGFVHREADPEDRRNTLVSLTPAGQARTEEIRGIMDRYMSAVAERMGDQRLRALFRELDALAEISEEVIGEIKGGFDEESR